MSELPKKLVVNQKRTDIGFLDDMGLFVHICTLELATEVCHRWNCHDELVKVCNEVRDWLAISSLQEVIVHSEKPETDALIMGIASHLTRIEAALAKVKEKT